MLKLHEALKLSHPDSYVRQHTHVSSAEGKFIQVNDCELSFEFQEGSINENHSEGVIVEDLLKFSKEFIGIMQDHVPCIENEAASLYIGLAIAELDKRTKDRIDRGVEGYGKV